VTVVPPWSNHRLEPAVTVPREIQEQMDALLDSLCAQRALGPPWIVGRCGATVTHFNFTFVARR
jgi:hypothetical protein